MSRFRLLLLILTTCLFGLAVANDGDIAVLTDANFEHDTQATTGSTTGRWLVLFHDGNDASLRRMLTTPSVLEGEEELQQATMVQTLLDEGVVVGMMDISSNPNTVQRLNIPGAPHAIMLAKGKLYRTNSMEDLQDFAISEYEIVTPEEIPPLPSPLDTLLAHPNGKVALVGIAGSLLLLVLALAARSLTGAPAPAAAPKKKN